MEILEKLGIKTNNVHLYEEAFTHSSYANEENTTSYERLEYLGDAVFELIITEYLYKTKPDESEGVLTKLRAHYVCENALYDYSLKLGLNEYIRLGRGEEEHGGKYRKATVADIFESFLGALYLDKGLEEAKKFVYKYVIPIIESQFIEIIGDYKSSLQELVQTDKRILDYVVVNEEGPAHQKVFTVVVKIDDIVYGEGTASSKKEAEQLAAKDALSKIARWNTIDFFLK